MNWYLEAPNVLFRTELTEPYEECLLDYAEELYENLDNHYALIDQEIVWHGGINLLGRPDIYDNLIRLKSVEIATELLTLDKNE